MGMNVSQKLIKSHLVSGKMTPGEEIGLKIDQTLTQDATGTMVMLELEALGLKSAKTDISCQYVDHNQIQGDNKNPDDHIFLQTAAKKFGIWFSKPGNGISHMSHCEKFAVPGKTLLGSDSHTPATGSLGMLAIGLSSMYLGFIAWYRGLRDFGVAHGSQVQQLQAIMTLGWSALLLGEVVTLTMVLSAIGIVLCVLWALSNVNKVKS